MTDREETIEVPVAEESDERAAHVFEAAAAWLFSDSMAGLLAEFDQKMPPEDGPWISLRPLGDWLPQDEHLPGWLDPLLTGAAEPAGRMTAAQVGILRRVLALERVSAGPFDFRRARDGGYVERAEIRDGDITVDGRRRVQEYARRSGLVRARAPRYPAYDHTLVLGGGYRTPLRRAELAAELAGRGINLGFISFLGSPRVLLVPKPNDDGETPPPEHQSTDDFAPGATDEFDLMAAAAGAAMGLRSGPIVQLCGCPSTAQICPQWSHAGGPAGRTNPKFTHERKADLFDSSGPVGMVLSASTSRPGSRPNTADTLHLWARLVGPRPGQRVLGVTTQVFVPFQTFDSLRELYLPYGLDVELVGLDARSGDRPETAEYLLQETLSAIRSARRLVMAAAELLGARGGR